MGFSRRIQNHPRMLAVGYRANHWIAMKLRFLIRLLGAERLARWLYAPEEFSKRRLFDCRMCGQCILHSTGMTCPMTCPKNLRNGPCGGVRANGHSSWVNLMTGADKIEVAGWDDSPEAEA